MYFLNEMSDVNLMNICRICLRQMKELTELFCKKDASRDILNKIFLCFQITIKPEKNLPNAICETCVTELNKANEFRIMCITTNERFAALYQNLSKIKLEISDQPNSVQIKDIQECFDETNHELDEVDLKGFSGGSTDFIKESFVCNTCNKVLKSMASLLKHNVSMHERRKRVGKVTGFGSERRYHCNSCEYSTPHSQTLTNHMRRHNGDRPYSCECGKNFTQSSSLAAHRKTHSSATFFTCSVCGKQFKHAFTLKNHQIVHENGHFNCTICQKTLKTKRSLQAHMHRHYNIYNYSCPKCGDSFVTSAELLNHKKKHEFEKEVECHLCGYKTHTKKNLVIHLKRHVGNKEHKCDICQVPFYTRSDLQRHRRVHTQEKPYSCPTCAQRFTQSTSVNKHMQTVHGIDFKWGNVKWKQSMLYMFLKHVTIPHYRYSIQPEMSSPKFIPRAS